MSEKEVEKSVEMNQELLTEQEVDIICSDEAWNEVVDQYKKIETILKKEMGIKTIKASKHDASTNTRIETRVNIDYHINTDVILAEVILEKDYFPHNRSRFLKENQWTNTKLSIGKNKVLWRGEIPYYFYNQVLDEYKEYRRLKANYEVIAEESYTRHLQ